jgi:hypothetical protein
MQCAALTQRNADETALGSLCRLANSLGNLTGLAVTKPDATLLVANNDKSSEAEPPAALHNLRDAIDVDQTIHKFAVTLLAITTTAITFTSHFLFPSLAQSA